MTAQELKNSILQLAVEGKLINNEELIINNGETGAELLERIRKEKAKLIAQGKIKKEKDLPPIAEDEKPFDIPENWCWCRLNDAALLIGDIDHKMPQETENGYPYISPRDFTENGINFENAKKITEEDYLILSKKIKPEKDDIIFPRYGTIGVVRLVNTDRKFLVSYSCCTIKNIKKIVEPLYVFYVLQSNLIKNEIKRYINKTTQPNVGLDSIKKFLFPLPPLSEQKAIVAKIEELLPYIEKYDAAYTKLEEFNKKFPEDMQKSILQQAVQGKLVPQDKSDGNAKALLAQIKAEKAKLIAEGKIKKEKSLAEITEDEIPFDIPENWCWCRLGEIGDWGAGATPQRGNAEYYQNGTIPWIKTGELNNGIVNEAEEFVTEKALKECSLRYNKIGDVLIAMYGATIGKLAIAGINLTTNQACCACTPYDGIYNMYLFYFLMSQKDAFSKKAEGGAQPNISREKIVRTIFPLPPLAEQKRIVAKIEKLLPLCKKLER